MGTFSQFRHRFLFTSKMKYFKVCVLVLLLVLHHHIVKSELTEKQLQSFVKMIRNVCQPKTKVTTGLIDAMHQGEFVQERTLMCYMECCLKMAKLIKDRKFDYDSAVEQVKTSPLERRQPTLEAVNSCKDSGGQNDKCEAAFDIYKCIYDANPSNFFLA